MKRHKHPGRYLSKTSRGRHAWKRRPMHKHRMQSRQQQWEKIKNNTEEIKKQIAREEEFAQLRKSGVKYYFKRKPKRGRFRKIDASALNQELNKEVVDIIKKSVGTPSEVFERSSEKELGPGNATLFSVNRALRQLEGVGLKDSPIYHEYSEVKSKLQDEIFSGSYFD